METPRHHLNDQCKVLLHKCFRIKRNFQKNIQLFVSEYRISRDLVPMDQEARVSGRILKTLNYASMILFPHGMQKWICKNCSFNVKSILTEKKGVLFCKQKQAKFGQFGDERTMSFCSLMHAYFQVLFPHTPRLLIGFVYCQFSHRNCAFHMWRVRNAAENKDFEEGVCEFRVEKERDYWIGSSLFALRKRSLADTKNH